MPLFWVVRTASQTVSYSISNWRIILVASLLLWADTDLVEHTNETLEVVDTVYTQYMSPVLQDIKVLLNVGRLALDLAVPIWNLFWWCFRCVPIDVITSSIDCTMPLISATYRELSAFTLRIVLAIDTWLSAPAHPLQLTDAFYTLQAYSDALVATLKCFCRDIGDVVETAAILVTAPSSAWAASNFTNIGVGTRAHAQHPTAQTHCFSQACL